MQQAQLGEQGVGLAGGGGVGMPMMLALTVQYAVTASASSAAGVRRQLNGRVQSAASTSTLPKISGSRSTLLPIGVRKAQVSPEPTA